MAKALNPYYSLCILLLAALLVYANYESGWVYAPTGFLRSFAWYALPYWFAFGLQYVFDRTRRFHRHPGWWAIVIGAPAIFALRTSLQWPEYGSVFFIRCIGYLARAACLILPVYIFWLIKDRKTQPLYGWRSPGRWKNLWYLLLVLVPIWGVAVGQPSMLAAYPKAAFLHAIPMPTLLSHWYYPAFETSYGVDLFSMEFFFRGFLILGLLRICKGHGVIPAALFYCMVHFGRPMAECISSFFGAILLGSVALETRSIFVGVALHLCLAWGLEVLSALMH
jgi:hypothetical protein